MMLDARAVLEEFRRKENTARREAAERICALSRARLACQVCRAEELLTIEMTLQYLAYGWPLCHGQEMVVKTG